VIGTNLPHSILPSPNINERSGNKPVSILILHYTGMETAEKACDWLCREESQVSCHYLVDEKGRIIQMVDETMRAWHAGVSSWHGEEDINSFSIGIEIQNPGHGLGYLEFPAVQMDAVAALAKDIVSRHAIAPRNVLAHSDVAPGRKIDPGEKFDWRFLHTKGIGHFVDPEPLGGGSFLQEGDSGDPVFALQAMLKLYGYGLEASGTFDKRTKLVVEAFQRHFRQERVDGIADASTVGTLHKLLRQA
jgi:N-acetylmuramoyl-L-alanine amidase